MLLWLLVMLMLTGCKPQEQDPVLDLPQPSQGTDNTPQQPDVQEEITGWTCAAEDLYSLDTSAVSGEIEHVLCSEEQVLVFAREQNGVSVYPYDLRTGLAAGNGLFLGELVYYPDAALQDGTFALVRSEDQPGQWETVVFLDPAAMAVQTISLPRPGAYYGLHFSPDRQYAALSTFEGLQVFDGATMTQLLLAIPVVTEEAEDHAERQTVWAEAWHDGTVLTARLAEPDLVKCPVIIDMADKSITYIRELDLCQGRLLADGTILWHNYFNFAPAGLYDRTTGQRTELAYLDTLFADATTCIALSDETVALTYITMEQGTPQDAWISVMTLRQGFTVARTSLPLEGVYGAFEQVFYAPDGTALLAVFARDGAEEKTVYRLALN